MWKFDNPPFDSKPVHFEDIVRGMPGHPIRMDEAEFSDQSVMFIPATVAHGAIVRPGQPVSYDEGGLIVPFGGDGIPVGKLVIPPGEDGICSIQIMGTW
jgi:hypothetical protein